MTEPHECWKIVDTRTGRRATIVSYFTREQAQREIEGWFRRHERGGRPDITLEMLQAYEPRPSTHEHVAKSTAGADQ